MTELCMAIEMLLESGEDGGGFLGWEARDLHRGRPCKDWKRMERRGRVVKRTRRVDHNPQCLSMEEGD